MPPAVIPKGEEALETNTVPNPNSGILDYTAHSEPTATPLWTPQTILPTLPISQRPPGYDKNGSHTGELKALNTPPSSQNNGTTAPSSTSSQPTTPIAFFHLLSRLKTTKREGWRRFGIIHGESISDHMYRMSMICLAAPASLRDSVNLDRCVKMALVHDVAELLVGDITPVDGILKSEKNRREALTMDFLCKEMLGNVDGGVGGKEIRELWQEYEDSKTQEAVFVHDVDKIELCLQMIEYEKEHQSPQLDLGEFSRVARRIVLPEVQAWATEVLKEREQYWKGRSLIPVGHEIGDELRVKQDEYYGSVVNGHVNGETNGVGH